MEDQWILSEKEGVYCCSYEEQYGILYQKQILESGSVPFLLPCTLEGNRLRISAFGRIPLTEWTKKEPGTNEIIELLTQFDRVLKETDDYFLDQQRFVWKTDFWFWDAETKNLAGIYVPDRRMDGKSEFFLQSLAEGMIRQALEADWKNESVILLLHRFFCAAKKIKEQEMSLTEFLRQENRERQGNSGQRGNRGLQENSGQQENGGEGEPAVSQSDPQRAIKDPFVFPEPVSETVQTVEEPKVEYEHDLFRAWDEMEKEGCGKKKGRKKLRNLLALPFD